MKRKQIIYHLFWALIAIAAIIGYAALISEIDLFYDKHVVSGTLNLISKVIGYSLIVRWSVVSILFILVVHWSVRIWHQGIADFRVNALRTIIGCVSIYICLYDQHWNFNELVGDITFAHYLTALSAWLFLFSNFCYIRIYITSLQTVGYVDLKPNNDGQVKRFTTDYIEEKFISEHISAYARELSERIDSTDIGNEAFAVGVAGSWGTGKTTFLKAFKKELSKNVIFFDFVPWNCHSASSINDDFFSKFRDVLSVHVDPFLSKPVSSYARHLNTINRMDPWWAFVRNIFLAHTETDTETLKNRIADSLKSFEKKIVVFIDDIDRLEKDELFEVLRLIRNTANLPNLVYVVTYDKDYVVSLLAAKGISSPNLYLEKIFNVEVMLPKVTRFDLLCTLYEDLELMIPIEVVQDIKDKVSELGLSYTVCHLLKNFREIKRFARQFAMHYTFVINNLREEDICNSDFFLLELIRYADFKVYSALRDDPSKILTWAKNSQPKSTALGKDVLQELSQDFEGERKYNRYVLALIKQLFSESARRQSNSVAYANNFTRYFTLGIEGKKLYQFEVDALLNSDELEIATTIAKWFQGDEDSRRDINSLLFLLDMTDVSKLSDNQWSNMFNVIGCLYDCGYNMIALNRLLSNNLADDRIPEGDNEEMKDFLKKKLKYIFSNSDNATLFSHICKSRMADNLLLSEEDWSELMNYVMDLYLKNCNPDAIDALNKQSKLYTLISNGFKTYYVTDEHGYEIDDYTENVVWDTIINYFKNHPSSHTEQFDNFFKSDITDEEMFSGMNQNEVYENFRAKVDDYFRTEEFLSSYRENCFESPSTDSRQQADDTNTTDAKVKQRDHIVKTKSKNKLLKSGQYRGRQGKK